jgi:hypothetical protein
VTKLVAATVVVLVFPAAALAAEPTIVSREVPLKGQRLLAAAAPERFNLVGLHWRGPGSVEFRTRSVPGRWSGWRAAAPEDEDRPDRRGEEHGAERSWKVGNPYWTGAADTIQYRLHGRVRRLRAHFVWSPVERVPLRAVSRADSPAILSRFVWQANEGIRRAGPRYATAVRFALVHHTAGSNSYGRAQSAAIVRAIQLYHVKGNGWDDVGYNFLVDRYGQVFEGRFGGIERPVIGAHAEGFNRGSTGVAVLGSYGSAGLTAAARRALVNLLAWRLDVAHLDPITTLSWPSGGNPRFPSGIPVFLRTISGHRDTGFTSCPGGRLYSQLNGIARSVGGTGLPKLYAPATRGTLGGRVRFTGRLSQPLPWTVSVTDVFGVRLASGTGTSAAVDWTWDASFVPRGRYAWTIEAGPDVRPARGTLGGNFVPLPLLGEVIVVPKTVSPNADSVDDSATLRYTLGSPAAVTTTVVDPAGQVLATLGSERKEPGRHSLRFSAETMPDGRYRIVLAVAADDGRQATASADVVVSRVLRAFTAAPALFSPNGDGRLEQVRFSFELAVVAQVRLRVVRLGQIAFSHSGQLSAGRHEVVWQPEERLSNGRYTAELTVVDAVAGVTQRVPITVDTTAPTLRLLSLARLSFWVSEPATVTLVVNGQRLTHAARRAGRFRVPFEGSPRRVQAVAQDAAGNTGIRVSAP